MPSNSLRQARTSIVLAGGSPRGGPPAGLDDQVALARLTRRSLTVAGVAQRGVVDVVVQACVEVGVPVEQQALGAGQVQQRLDSRDHGLGIGARRLIAELCRQRVSSRNGGQVPQGVQPSSGGASCARPTIST